jgi:hypothetical protein
VIVDDLAVMAEFVGVLEVRRSLAWVEVADREGSVRGQARDEGGRASGHGVFRWG